MKQLLLQLLMLVPAIIESLFIDPLFWKHKNVPNSDKPWSTYIRVLMILIIGLLIQFTFKDNWAILGMIGVVVYYFAGFNYMVNWRLGEEPMYKQYKIPGLPVWQLMAVLWFIVIYLTFNSTINEGFSIPFNLPRFR